MKIQNFDLTNSPKLMNVSTIFLSLMVTVFASGLFSCSTVPEKPKEKDIVKIPEQLDIRIKRNIKKNLEFILANKGRLSDTVLLSMDSVVGALYSANDYKPLWSRQENWLPQADSLYSFIEHSKEYGLFPTDYHYRALQKIRLLVSTDTTSGKDAALWSRGDLIFSDALFLVAKHLKQGRLQYDSVTLRRDTVLPLDFFFQVYEQLKRSNDLAGILHTLEPKHAAYDSLKTGLKVFLDSVTAFRRFTYLPYPVKDSASFYGLLQKRFFEDDIVLSATDQMDTTAWKTAIRSYQQANGLKVTGKINETTVQSLNNTDWEKFKLIAINLDRYKLLPDTLPGTYVWVNLPSYRLKLVDFDSVALESRVIVGTSKTRTPLLTSEISNFITYPQWTVPYSIIFKEMLPQIQKSTEYLKKQNLMVVDKNDSIIDPNTIDWSKLSKKRFPYLLKQRQGDDNSLGVLKFNFANKYSVYLHDTNARWLFSKSSRALSHGCVRVKEWERLSHFLVKNDSIKYHPDTLRSWINRQEKHVVYGFRKIPIFIRYFTCEGSDGKVKFYDDIYGEDKILRQRYFADKSIN